MYRPTRRGFMMGCSAAIANVAAARFTSYLAQLLADMRRAML